MLDAINLNSRALSIYYRSLLGAYTFAREYIKVSGHSELASE